MKTLALVVLLAVIHASSSMHISHQTDSCLSVGDTLYGGFSLEGGQCLRSNNGQVEAQMQTDGNFVIYNGQRILFDTSTYGKGVAPWRITLQTDGNLVLYDAGSKYKWATKTDNKRESTRYRLVMQDDGDLVLFTPEGKAIWRSNTKVA